jgi:hypothetical protein
MKEEEGGRGSWEGRGSGNDEGKGRGMGIKISGKIRV